MSVFNKPDTPSPPNYAGAAAQQGQANIDSTVATGLINRPNEVNPFGSRTWNQTGSVDVNGNPIPTYTATTTLNPDQQTLLNNQVGLKLGMSGTGQSLLNQVINQWGQPADFSKNRDSIVQSMFNRSTRMLNPYYTQQQDALNTDLANRGFSVGDKGYETAQGNFQRNKDMVYSNAMDTANTAGAQQAISEELQRRALPAQELSQLMGASAPNVPNFQPYAGAGTVAPAPDFAATQAAGNFAQQNYATQAGIYNNQMQGLFGLGAAGMMSDTFLPWLAGLGGGAGAAAGAVGDFAPLMIA